MNGRVFATAVAVVVFYQLVFAGPTAAQTETAPLFRVESETVEIDRVIAGRQVSATFVFHNDSPEDVHIIRAKPS